MSIELKCGKCVYYCYCRTVALKPVCDFFKEVKEK